MIRRLVSIGSFLEKIEECTATFFMIVAICLCLYNIFFRAFGGSVGSWVQSLIQYLVIWSAFLSVGYVLRRNRHIEVLALLKRLPNNVRRISEIVIHLLGLIVCSTVVIYGFQNIMKLKSINTAVYEFFDLPVYPFVLSVPFGMTLLSFHFVEKLCILFSTSSHDKKDTT
jgi:TRAP-type C4-dicarboxylate transport system permease small subunit